MTSPTHELFVGQVCFICGANAMSLSYNYGILTDARCKKHFLDNGIEGWKDES
jgi:hypothetical protein